MHEVRVPFPYQSEALCRVWLSKVISMNHRLTTADRIVSLVLGTICIVIVIVTLYPLLNVLSISMSGDSYVLANRITFYPKAFTMAAYKAVIENRRILGGFANSIFVAGVGCVLSLIVTLIAAYPLAFCEFPGKKIYNIFVLLPMWFSAGMIPQYLCISKLHLVNSLWSLILTQLIVPYYLLILISFLRGLPKELIESARIDGAGDWRIMVQIVAPLSKASLATIALWVIATHWNAYMDPLLYISDFNKFTLQQVLRDIVLSANAYKYELGSASSSSLAGMALADQLKNAVLIVSMIPMICIYPFVQRYFVQGVTLGAVKG